MRYSTISAAALVILVTWGSISSADSGSDATPAPRAAVVAIMKDAGQALLWDANQGEYVVVRVGDRFHEYRVTSIDKEQVVLTRSGGKDHFILPRTSDTSELAVKGKPGARPPAPARTATRDPAGDLLDPYPRAVEVLPSSEDIGDLSVLDPYGTTAPITTVVAPKKRPIQEPLDPYASASRPSVQRADPSAPFEPYASSGPLDPYAGASRPSTPTVDASASVPLDPYAAKKPSSADPGAPLDPYASKKPEAKASGKKLTENRRISRRELDNAVTDFPSLTKEAQFVIVDQGVRVDGITAGSLFHRWGFRAGDIVMNVDGKSIRGVDDAAAIYAHLMDARKFTVEVRRGVDTVVMKFRFKK